MAQKVTVDAKKAFRKLQRTQRLILLYSKKSVENLALLGKVRAKEIAPYFSGRTAKLIRILPVRQLKDGVRASVIAPNPTLNDGHIRKIANFNLVKWMHETKGILRGRKHIRSGEPQFMYKTRDYLNRIKRKTAQAQFNKLKL